MQDPVFARDTNIWRNLINAVALEMGIAPLLSNIEAPHHEPLFKDVPEPDKRVLTRKYRKMKRQLIKHSRGPKRRDGLRYNRAILKMIIIDFVERACVKNFGSIAALFNDTNGNYPFDVANWRKHRYYFSPDEYDRLSQAYERAADKLTKGTQ